MPLPSPVSLFFPVPAPTLLSGRRHVSHIGNQSVCSFSLGFLAIFPQFFSRVYVDSPWLCRPFNRKELQSRRLRTQYLLDVLTTYVVVTALSFNVTPVLVVPCKVFPNETMTATDPKRKRNGSRRRRKLSQFPHRFRSKLRRPIKKADDEQRFLGALAGIRAPMMLCSHSE